MYELKTIAVEVGDVGGSCQSNEGLISTPTATSAALIYFQISFNQGTAFLSPSTKRLVS